MSALASLAGIQASSNPGADPSAYLNEILEDDQFLEKVLTRKWAFKGDSLTLTQIWQKVPDTTGEDGRYVFIKKNLSNLKNEKTIKLTKKKENGVFLLETGFPDPKLSYQVNHHILESLAAYLSESFQTKTREKRRFIEKRVQEIEAELKKDEDVLTAFRQRNRDLSAPAVFLESARLERAVRIDQELYLQLKKEFEIAKIDERNDTPLLEIISQPFVPIAKAPSKLRFLPYAGAAGGLILGGTWALALGWYRKEFA